MESTYIRAYKYLIKEKLRKFIHPTVYKNSINIFEERRKFYSLFLFKNDLVFDIGANLGNRVEVFLNLKNKVVAVEPQDFCCQFLKLKYSKSITLVKCAMGAEKGTSQMFINSKASTISSLSKDWIEKVKKGRFKDHEWN